MLPDEFEPATRAEAATQPALDRAATVTFPPRFLYTKHKYLDI